jgi:hypothetical protein
MCYIRYHLQSFNSSRPVCFRHAGLFIYSFNVNVRPLIAGRTFLYRTSCIVRSSNAHSGIDPRSGARPDPADHAGYRVDRLIGDALDIVPAVGHGDRRFHLVGHDWGASLASQIADRRSQIADRRSQIADRRSQIADQSGLRRSPFYPARSRWHSLGRWNYRMASSGGGLVTIPPSSKPMLGRTSWRTMRTGCGRA